MARPRLTPTTPTKFSEYLNQLMGDRPAEWLAKQIGLNQSTVARYRSGESLPNGMTMVKIADVLGADLHEMFQLVGGEHDLGSRHPRVTVIAYDLNRLLEELDTEAQNAVLDQFDGMLRALWAVSGKGE